MPLKIWHEIMGKAGKGLAGRKGGGEMMTKKKGNGLYRPAPHFLIRPA